jgi:hypothetical protein
MTPSIHCKSVPGRPRGGYTLAAGRLTRPVGASVASLQRPVIFIHSSRYHLSTLKENSAHNF